MSTTFLEALVHVVVSIVVLFLNGLFALVDELKDRLRGSSERHLLLDRSKLVVVITGCGSKLKHI